METLGIHIHIKMGTVGLKYTAKISVGYQKYPVEYALQFNSTIFTENDFPATAEWKRWGSHRLQNRNSGAYIDSNELFLSLPLSLSLSYSHTVPEYTQPKYTTNTIPLSTKKKILRG